MSLRPHGGPALLAAGDLAPTRPLVPATPATAEVWDYIRSAALATANLEIPLTRHDAPADKAITLRADPGVAPSLREAGIELVTVANNHALDHGAEGLSETLSSLRHVGIAAVGGGRNVEEASRPALVPFAGATVAVLGIACTLPPGFAAGVLRPGVAPVRVKSRLLLDAVTLDEQPGMAPWVETEPIEQDVLVAERWVAAAREEADLVVLHVHWGVPNGWCAAFQGPLADYQRPLGRRLVEAGADLVVGHHPHVVHGVETYAGGLIAYSLGNFLFHGMAEDEGELELSPGSPPYDTASLQEGEARLGVILALEWEGRTKSVHFLPTRMNARGEPEFATGTEAEHVLGRLAEHSARLGTELEVSDGMARL